MVGVNRFQTDASGNQPIEPLRIDAAAEASKRKTASLRMGRGGENVERSLDALRRAAESRENLMPPTLDAVRAYATVGEICGALRDVFGSLGRGTV